MRLPPLLSLLAAVGLSAWAPASGQTSTNPVRLMMDLSAEPDAVMLSAFDLCIVDAHAKVDLEAQQTLGNKMLARINLFEARPGSVAATAAREADIPLLEASQKGFVRLDATHPHWVPVVVYKIVQEAAERGFDGFVLTGMETLSQDAERAACVRAIMALDEAYPDKELVIEGALDLVPETRRALEDVLFLRDRHPAETLDRRIREVKRQGIRPLVVDFAAQETSREEIQERTRHFRSMGAVPFFTTPALDGMHLGPLQEVIRRIVVIHSGPARDSYAARQFHGCLEWLGHEVHYADASAASDWQALLPDASGVILDASLKTTPELQAPLLDLVDELTERHIPLLLTGATWGTADEFAPWAKRLRLGGNGQPLAAGENTTLSFIETSWLQEDGIIRPRSLGFRQLEAPVGAQVLCSLQTPGGKSGAVFDSIFLAPWGGLWMDPLADAAGPQLRPLPFLENWLGLKGGSQQPAPVPDVTAKNGRRLLIPTVSSEGFTQPTGLQGLPIAGEAFTTRIISRYSLPFTVAFSEGDLRGLAPGLAEEDALRYETAARALLAYPHVCAASASTTRPQDWSQLSTAAMQREVAGSMAYIHRQLLPAGRRVEMMLWPQNSVPTPDAVAFSRRMGAENMQPLSSATLLGHTPAPAANAWSRAETLQVTAPSLRNEGPLNAAAFIARTDARNRGRWMSPVHLPLSFQDAADEAALTEAGIVLDWCASQPLHAISAPEYARLVRDAAQTRFFEQGPGHWIIVNAGYARTLRLPATAGMPDLDRSIGIAGYTVRGEDLYIHTLGRRRTELVLSPQGTPAHLRLVESSGSIRYLEAGQQRALLQVADVRPVELSFSGIRPGSTCQIFTTEQPQFLTADMAGRVDFTVPAQTTVRIQVLSTPQAAMR